MDRRVEGVLLVSKPEGPTSHDVVQRVRQALRQRRVGHSGTLDPMATGLLALVLGRATRLVRFLPSSPKLYDGTLQLGVTSDTDDRTGRLSPVSAPLPIGAHVLDAALRLEGRYLQAPPAISARKVGGERLYRLSRSTGVAVEAPPAEVEVRRFALQPTSRPDVYGFVAEVSAGTYVRALARDLGRLLGCGAVLTGLRRTKIGGLSLDQAVSVPADGRADGDSLLGALIPLDAMPLDLPRVMLAGDPEARSFRQGVAIALPVEACGSSGRYAVHDTAGALLGVADRAGGLLRPCVVLSGAAPGHRVGPAA